MIIIRIFTAVPTIGVSQRQRFNDTAPSLVEPHSLCRFSRLMIWGVAAFPHHAKLGQNYKKNMKP